MKSVKIGDKVIMVDCLEASQYKDTLWTVKSAPWKVCGTVLVLLEGYRGGFNMNCLKIIKGACLKNDK